MADDRTDPEAPDTGAEPPAAPARRRRPIDARTLAICACIALVVALVAALVASAVVGDDGDDDRTGDLSLSPVTELLEVKLTTVQGAETSLDALLGTKPMLVNLWQQSCVPCIDEMPLLERASKANPKIDVLGVDTQDRLDHAKAMAAQTGITYPWVQDELGDFFAAAEASGLPTTLLVDPAGRVLGTRSGAFKTLADLQSFIDDHVA